MLQSASPAKLAPPAPVMRHDHGDEPAFGRIDTSRARLRLVHAGPSGHEPASGLYPFNGDGEDQTSDGWLWEALSSQGQSFGFIGLVPVRTMGGPQTIFGPMLTVMLKRDLAPRLGAEIVAGLVGWFGRCQVGHVVHATHTETDSQLAAWLDAAGFLYTGRRDGDGSRSMILIV